MVQVKEIRQMGLWSKPKKESAFVDSLKFVSKWTIIKTLEQGINEFLKENKIHKEDIIDIKYQVVQTDDWQESIALIIYLE